MVIGTGNGEVKPGIGREVQGWVCPISFRAGRFTFGNLVVYLIAGMNNFVKWSFQPETKTEFGHASFLYARKTHVSRKHEVLDSEL